LPSLLLNKKAQKWFLEKKVGIIHSNNDSKGRRQQGCG
jgi:hypothetical protein